MNEIEIDGKRYFEGCGFTMTRSTISKDKLLIGLNGQATTMDLTDVICITGFLLNTTKEMWEDLMRDDDTVSCQECGAEGFGICADCVDLKNDHWGQFTKAINEG